MAYSLWLIANNPTNCCHCEERSDEAIYAETSRSPRPSLHSELAMTGREVTRDTSRYPTAVFRLWVFGFGYIEVVLPQELSFQREPSRFVLRTHSPAVSLE